MSVSEPLFLGYLTVGYFSRPSLDPRQTAKSITGQTGVWVDFRTALLAHEFSGAARRLGLAKLPVPQWGLKSKVVYYRMIGQLKVLKELIEWRSYVFGSEGVHGNLWIFLEDPEGVSADQVA
ncbi:hypothetical protein BGX30_009917 [Mortierella sp. GBA39]|nr:hypothetical protein BGX30_009917 [Mortierella sp. GBA39]